ncbi:molybdenum cofactor biosynthesis protein MoaE [Candidatus Villigracilis proximus]|uniref:molybdenum cofactor biosynthesis protein MoaE n=1 Tax=Candidatus Villigracilis proximus TaxID=3140683 RepID=UPI0031EA2430
MRSANAGLSSKALQLFSALGSCIPKTPTVLIACTAAHRDTGVFDAARYGIDRLKEIVPVWKKEIGLGGAEWVEGEYIPKPGSRDVSANRAVNPA